jgi:hypothetical protein
MKAGRLFVVLETTQKFYRFVDIDGLPVVSMSARD